MKPIDAIVAVLDEASRGHASEMTEGHEGIAHCMCTLAVGWRAIEAGMRKAVGERELLLAWRRLRRRRK